MSTRLKAFRFRTYTNLYESLSEIFDSEPLMRIFTFTSHPEDIKTVSTKFKDEKGNSIDVQFVHWDKGIYTLDFSVNGDSFENPEIECTVREYAILLNTVAAAVSQFLEEFNPKGLHISGADSLNKIEKNSKSEGQKTRIYHAFTSQILDTNGRYAVDRDNKTGELSLVRI